MKNLLHKSDELAYIKAQTDYLEKLAVHCDYAITLQTCLPTYAVSEATMEKRIELTRRSLFDFRLRFNRLMTGNGWRRNNNYLPIFLAAIEGTQNTYDKNRTLHIHIAVGNLHQAATQELIADGIRQLWMATEIGTEDIMVDRLTKDTEVRWIKYISKEAGAGNWQCIDYINTQVPQKILEKINN
jgi:hypothetical protein